MNGFLLSVGRRRSSELSTLQKRSLFIKEKEPEREMSMLQLRSFRVCYSMSEHCQICPSNISYVSRLFKIFRGSQPQNESPYLPIFPKSLVTIQNGIFTYTVINRQG